MQQHEFFRLPTRVSRMYPLLSFTLAVTTAIMGFAWQRTYIELSSLSENVLPQRERLEKQVDQLTRQQELDKSTLELQKQKIAASTEKLNGLQSQLSARQVELDATQQKLKQAQEQLGRQNQQLTDNATELAKLRSRPPLFSFQNLSSNSNIGSQGDDVKQLVTTAYDYMQELYGTPYLLQSITISFVDELSIEGSSGETVIETGPKGVKITIRMLDFDKDSFVDVNTLIHEVVHGFHGVATFDSAALEEGITVAVSDAVMQKMTKDGKLSSFGRYYLHLTDAEYATLNSTLRVFKNSDQFYTSKEVISVYQLVGTAWYRLYLEDNGFFKKFNDAYYPKIQRGEVADDALVRNTIKSVITKVQDTGIDSYLDGNRAFNPS